VLWALLRRRAALPLAIFVLCAGVYVATLGSRARGISDNAHYVYLAQSLLHGQLSLVDGRPPGDNDWSFYQGHWYVAFPPFPAVVIAPLVALFGTAVWDRLLWAVLAGVAPALLFVLLRRLRELGSEGRGVREDLALVALFAFGSPYYYTAVQGTVWFAAHVVACALIAVYLLAAFGAARPLLAGAALGLAFMTRPTTLLLGLFFAHQLFVDAQRRDAAGETARGLRAQLARLEPRRALVKLAWFALPLLVVGGVYMWMNAARFGDPFDPGYGHLRIRWAKRIETWGLFNYHYLGRNLAVFLASLPWLSAEPPYLKISRHGLALWVTTPQLLLVLWPKRVSPAMTALAWSAGAVALANLCYQNSGWVQFGYRFSLDYSLLLFVLLALGGRRFGKPFYGLLVVAIAINTFGALTFDRAPRFYDTDASQRVIFQPD
jgi:hypothetical protein